LSVRAIEIDICVAGSIFIPGFHEVIGMSVPLPYRYLCDR